MVPHGDQRVTVGCGSLCLSIPQFSVGASIFGATTTPKFQWRWKGKGYHTQQLLFGPQCIVVNKQLKSAQLTHVWTAGCGEFWYFLQFPRMTRDGPNTHRFGQTPFKMHRTTQIEVPSSTAELVAPRPTTLPRRPSTSGSFLTFPTNSKSAAQ